MTPSIHAHLVNNRFSLAIFEGERASAGKKVGVYRHYWLTAFFLRWIGQSIQMETDQGIFHLNAYSLNCWLDDKEWAYFRQDKLHNPSFNQNLTHQERILRIQQIAIQTRENALATFIKSGPALEMVSYLSVRDMFHWSLVNNASRAKLAEMTNFYQSQQEKDFAIIIKSIQSISSEDEAGQLISNLRFPTLEFSRPKQLFAHQLAIYHLLIALFIKSKVINFNPDYFKSLFIKKDLSFAKSIATLVGYSEFLNSLYSLSSIVPFRVQLNAGCFINFKEGFFKVAIFPFFSLRLFQDLCSTFEKLAISSEDKTKLAKEISKLIGDFLTLALPVHSIEERFEMILLLKQIQMPADAFLESLYQEVTRSQRFDLAKIILDEMADSQKQIELTIDLIDTYLGQDPRPHPAETFGLLENIHIDLQKLPPEFLTKLKKIVNQGIDFHLSQNQFDLAQKLFPLLQTTVDQEMFYVKFYKTYIKNCQPSDTTKTDFLNQATRLFLTVFIPNQNNGQYQTISIAGEAKELIKLHLHIDQFDACLRILAQPINSTNPGYDINNKLELVFKTHKPSQEQPSPSQQQVFLSEQWPLIEKLIPYSCRAETNFSQLIQLYVKYNQIQQALDLMAAFIQYHENAMQKESSSALKISLSSLFKTYRDREIDSLIHSLPLKKPSLHWSKAQFDQFVSLIKTISLDTAQIQRSYCGNAVFYPIQDTLDLICTNNSLSTNDRSDCLCAVFENAIHEESDDNAAALFDQYLDRMTLSDFEDYFLPKIKLAVGEILSEKIEARLSRSQNKKLEHRLTAIYNRLASGHYNLKHYEQSEKWALKAQNHGMIADLCCQYIENTPPDFKKALVLADQIPSKVFKAVTLTIIAIKLFDTQQIEAIEMLLSIAPTLNDEMDFTYQWYSLEKIIREYLEEPNNDMKDHLSKVLTLNQFLKGSIYYVNILKDVAQKYVSMGEHENAFQLACQLDTFSITKVKIVQLIFDDYISRDLTSDAVSILKRSQLSDEKQAPFLRQILIQSGHKFASEQKS